MKTAANLAAVIALAVTAGCTSVRADDPLAQGCKPRTERSCPGDSSERFVLKAETAR